VGRSGIPKVHTQREGELRNYREMKDQMNSPVLYCNYLNLKVGNPAYLSAHWERYEKEEREAYRRACP
jgi:hypothetical protein